MAISDELRSNILRYYHAEKWKVGTIARQLKVHHSVVSKLLKQTGVTLTVRGSMIDKYLPFILETLAKYPRLSASRLYEMVKIRGYPGMPNHFRHLIALHRPKPSAEAYLRLRTLPGEQGQVDWGHFGTITIGKAKRSLMAFVIVLSYSRKIFLRFYLSQKTANFLRGHVAAFEAWNGVPRVLLYDNLKSATLERRGDAIRFNPALLGFAAHYRFEPRPVAVARGNEKGRVERAIRYIRDNFFAGRTWEDLEDLNSQALVWCNGLASDRPCPEDNSITVREAFTKENLIALPDNPYVTDEREEVRVGKTPYARFDLNDYSVPYTSAHKTLTVSATLSKVIILDGVNVIAEHARSYDKGQQIERAEHIAQLVLHKRNAKQHRSLDHLTKALASGLEFLTKAAEHNYSLRSITSQLSKLLDDYGAQELNEAMKEALAANVPHPNTVRVILDRRREKREPLVHLELPADPRVRGLTVQPHNLTNYDKLLGENND